MINPTHVGMNRRTPTAGLVLSTINPTHVGMNRILYRFTGQNNINPTHVGMNRNMGKY